MLRSTPIILFLATLLVGTQAIGPPDIVDSWNFYSNGNVSITTINSQLYAVSKNHSHISILSKDKTYKACYLVYKDNHEGRIQVANVKRKIFLLYRKESNGFKILQLDPFLCFYIPLTSLVTPTPETKEPQIIIMSNTLEVFINRTTDCFPCRFDVNGNQLEGTSQLKQGKSAVFKSIIIKGFAQNESTHNYAFAGNFGNETSVLKVLDDDFNTTKEIYLQYHQIEALATKSGPNGSWIGITYVGLGSPGERVLALYTSALELLFETRVEHDLNYDLYDTMLSINSTGYTFIYSVQWNKGKYVSYVIYDPLGQLDTSEVRSSNYGKQSFDIQLLQRNETFCCTSHQYDVSTSTYSFVHCF